MDGTMSDGTKTNDTVIDETAPGERPVTVSATEARASEPVLASEEALDKATPQPAHVADEVAASRTQGRTGDPGEPEVNADAHVPPASATTADGVTYEEVRDPHNPTERMMKRELELGAEMDYVEHRRTYAMFTEATKWGTIVVVALLVAMAVGFFTGAGFFGAFVMFLGALLGGFFFART